MMESKDLKKCEEICGEKLSCGHRCTYNFHPNDPGHFAHPCRLICEKKCANDTHTCLDTHRCGTECPPCQIRIYPVLACGHVIGVRCHQSATELQCTELCNRMLPCGHMCSKKCGEVCEDCKVTVEKFYPKCGHTIENLCCNFKLRQPCPKLVLTKKQPKCGHPRSVPCHMLKEVDEDETDSVICKEKCTGMKAGNGCVHYCPGDCFTCFQGRLHQRCNIPCNRKLLYCSHRCVSYCNKECPPCTQRCMAFCDHGRCEKVCCIPCEPCKEPCTAKCEHSACTKLCSEPCDREPCFLPCPRKLQCGHMCIGYCGETCPPLCRFCHRVEIWRNFVLEEDLTDDTRFIYLEGCHHTVDNETLTAWMKYLSSGGELEIASCPTCREPIYNLKRFSHIIAQNLRQIADCKFRQIGNIEENSQIIVELMGQLTNIGQSEHRFESTRMFLMHTLLESSNLFLRYKLICVHWIVGVLKIAEGAMKYLENKLNSVMFEHLVTLHSNLFDMMKSRFTPFEDREFDSINREIFRLNSAIKLLRRVTTTKNVQILLYTDGSVEARHAFRLAYTLVFNRRYFGEDDERQVLDLIETIDELIRINEDRETERLLTVFRIYRGNICHQGHVTVYPQWTVGMDIEFCNECNAQATGASRLLDMNKIPPEIQDLLLPF